MWSPTHVHVIVHSAQHLLIKGKHGTNNAFVVIELGKDSYRTSVQEKSGKCVTWNEECELKIPKAGNTANLVLTALHRNSLGLDQFLGTVKIPLVHFDKLQRSTEWYKLEGKPGKEKGKDKIRGELEVEIGFTYNPQSQSLMSLQSKGKTSLEHLTGSLFGLRNSDRRVGVKNFANTLNRAVLKKKRKDLAGSVDLQQKNNTENNNIGVVKNYNNLDPGVVSDDDDNSSQHSMESLKNGTETVLHDFLRGGTPPPKPRRTMLKNPQISVSHWEENDKLNAIPSLNVSRESVTSTGSRKPPGSVHHLQSRLADRRSSSCVDFSLLVSPKPEKKFSSSLNLAKEESHRKLSKFARKLRHFHSVDKKDSGRLVIGCEASGKFDEEIKSPKSEFKNKNKDELISMVLDLQKKVNCVSVRVKDLETYLDEILVKVMENVPTILEKS